MLSRVLPFAEQCPDELVVEHLREAARRWCERTRCWTLQVPPILTIAGEKSYALPVDEGQDVICLNAPILLDGSETDLVEASRGRAAVAHGTDQQFVYLDGPFDVVINPAPIASGSRIVLSLAVKPSITATFWPDDFDEYVPSIVNGAISSLAQIPRKPWSDRQLSVDKLGEFDAKAGPAAILIARNRSSVARALNTRFL